jgi:hypothetical protein
VTFKEGLILSRGHLVFLAGLAAAFGIAIALERGKVQVPAGFAGGASASLKRGAPGATLSPLPVPPPAPLTAEDLTRARRAWSYFEVNWRQETGLVDSVDRYPATTMWDTASYLMALLAARRLEVIPQATFDARTAAALSALARLPLFEGKLPNKSYNTLSLAMVDYNNRPAARGIGWSAIDIGRLLVPMNILVWQQPQHTPAVRAVVARWQLQDLVREGRLFGRILKPDGQVESQQEGRLGYEEYAAKSFTLLGQDVSAALSYDDFVRWVKIDGIFVATDSRTAKLFGAHNYVVSEPYVLDGLEFGWDRASRDLAARVFGAQEARFRRTGLLTAVSEDNIDRPPYFVYNTVFSDGKVWNTITDAGVDASADRSLSVKAAFGWDALYRTAYTARLVEAVKDLYDPARGYYSGRYESDGRPNKAITCNTNAIILESFAYRRDGPLVAGSSTGTPGKPGKATP